MAVWSLSSQVTVNISQDPALLEVIEHRGKQWMLCFAFLVFLSFAFPIKQSLSQSMSWIFIVSPNSLLDPTGGGVSDWLFGSWLLAGLIQDRLVFFALLLSWMLLVSGSRCWNFCSFPPPSPAAHPLLTVLNYSYCFFMLKLFSLPLFIFTELLNKFMCYVRHFLQHSLVLLKADKSWKH